VSEDREQSTADEPRSRGWPERRGAPGGASRSICNIVDVLGVAPGREALGMGKPGLGEQFIQFPE